MKADPIQSEPAHLPRGWLRAHAGRYVRVDGAVVRYDANTPHSNPAKASARMFTVWEPDPGERALSMRRAGSPYRWPRRFLTALAGMRAANREWPLPVVGRLGLWEKTG